jgi:hypothetical protein
VGAGVGIFYSSWKHPAKVVHSAKPSKPWRRYIHRMHASSKSQPLGFSIVELLFGLVLIVVCSSVLIGHVLMRYRHDTGDRNRTFAFNTARSILAECHAWSLSGRDLEGLDDGGVAQSTLGLARLSGADRADGNFQRGGEWVWSREIRVQPMLGVENRAIRVVTVRVFKRAADGSKHQIAELSSVVTASTVGYPSTRVFDLYLLAIENIPARGVDADNVRPFVESVITDLERDNPDLRLRTHWITKASYGRDRFYTPEVAGDNGARVYRYPSASGIDGGYAYDVDRIKGRVSVGGVVHNGHEPNETPLPYALADRFNHGMRLPAERAFHEERVRRIRERRRAIATARERGAPVPSSLADMSEEPTLRLFLEDLSADPEKYRHALILNLHGDAIPMPAIRNYSDAASDPVALPNLRCVTHPEELRTRRDPNGQKHDAVVLRVYAYLETADHLPVDGRCPDGHAITLRIHGVNLTDARRKGFLRPDVDLQNLAGGLHSAFRPFAEAKNREDPRRAREMYYHARFVDPGFGEEKFTRIDLFHTPVTCRSRAAGGRGLDRASRLYGLEYVPSPTGPKLDFSRDLSTAGAGPKNTARWRLTIPGSVFRDRRFVTRAGEYHDPGQDVCLKTETRFSRRNGSGAGRSSVTYAWWAATADAVPITERAQFLGDPRYCPYKDFATGDPDFGDGYNWFFARMEHCAAAYPALDADRLANGWLAGHRFDAPRYLSLLRRGLLRSRASFATVGSYGDARILIGGETRDGGPELARQNPARDYWWCRPWLGELYPDSAYTDDWLWRGGAGNLPRGGTDRGFRMENEVAVHVGSGWRRSHDVSFATDPTRRWSWQSFFNAEIAGRALGIVADGSTAALTGAGSALESRFRRRLPPTIGVENQVAWTRVGDTPEWSHAAYRAERCRARVARSYWDAQVDGAYPSALLELVDRDDRAGVVVHGLRGEDLGMRTRHALLMLLDARLSTGQAVPPSVRLLAPTETDELVDPTTLRLQWEAVAEGHGAAHAAPGVETTAVVPADLVAESSLMYALFYSRDDGRTWRHLPDGSFAQPGVRPTEALCRVDAGPGPEEFTVATPATRFPAGSYLLRVDLFVGNRARHSAQHTRRIVLVR